MSYDQIDGPDELWYTQMEAKVSLENTLFSVLPEDVAFAVQRHIRNRIERNTSLSGTDELIDAITRGVLGGNNPDSSSKHYLKMIKGSDIKMTPQQEQDIERLFDFLIEQEG